MEEREGRREKERERERKKERKRNEGGKREIQNEYKFNTFSCLESSMYINTTLSYSTTYVPKTDSYSS